MPLSRSRLQQLEVSTRFQLAWLEKALRLQEVLVGIQEDRSLKSRLALKGGTALNLAYLGLARLSIDLDFNYIGAIDRQDMEAERPALEERVERIGAGMGYGVRRLQGGHADTTWSLAYTAIRGGPDSLRVQINYLHRVPIFGTREIRSARLADEPTIALFCVSAEELVGGKLKALVERSAARDLFDAYRYTLTSIDALDPAGMRIAFTVLAATMARDVRSMAVDSIFAEITERDIREQLVPLVRRNEEVDRTAMIAATTPLLREHLDWSNGERAFLDSVMAGRIESEHLTSDVQLQSRIRNHPALQWKVINVAAYLRGDRPPEGRRRGRPRRGPT